MSTSSIEVRRLRATDYDEVSNFFRIVSVDQKSQNFHPHSFDDDSAEWVTSYKGRDLYLGLFINQRMLGYGLLRGWDEGFEIPSLGIYLAPDARGKGLSKEFMSAIHTHALKNGALKVRLKVYADNTGARRLYEKIGYVFASEEEGQLVGSFDLK